MTASGERDKAVQMLENAISETRTATRRDRGVALASAASLTDAYDQLLDLTADQLDGMASLALAEARWQANQGMLDRPPTRREIERAVGRLPATTTLIGFTLSTGSVLRWEVSRGFVSFRRLEQRRSTLESLADALSRTPLDLALQEAVGKALFSGLQSRARNRIVVILPGFLAAAPIQGVPEPSRTSTQSLARTTHFLWGQGNGPARGDELFVGYSKGVAELPQLPGVRREILALTGGRARAQVLLDEDAMVEQVQEELGRVALFHFSGHVLSSSVDPMKASLLMASSSGAQGFLTVARIQGLDLRRLGVVVLAGCASAASVEPSDPGSLSLAGAFLEAGAHQVIGTLRPLPDATATQIMTQIHASLRRGANAETAISEAKRALQSDLTAQENLASLVALAGGVALYEPPLRKETANGF